MMDLNEPVLSLSKNSCGKRQALRPSLLKEGGNVLRETKARLKDSKWSNVKFEKEFDRKEKNESEIDDGCIFSLRTGKKKGKGEEVGKRLRN